MKVIITGQHISMGSSLQEYVEDKLNNTVKRYFEHAISSSVHFVRDGYLFRCDIKVHEGTGRHAITMSDASSDDIYAAFDIALAKCEKQLRRYRSRLKDRHNKIKLSEASPELAAVKYVIQPQREEEEVDTEKNPVIIAENPVSLENLTVAEAVMKMDLENLPAVLFKNTKNHRINLVYYRSDGNISWVDAN